MYSSEDETIKFNQPFLVTLQLWMKTEDTDWSNELRSVVLLEIVEKNEYRWFIIIYYRHGRFQEETKSDIEYSMNIRSRRV